MVVKGSCAIFPCSALGAPAFNGSALFALALWSTPPQRQTFNMQNNEGLTFRLEVMLNSVSLEPQLPPTEVAWYFLSQITPDHAV